MAGYRKNDQVLDQGWLMIANKDTEERPAPQKVGSPFYVSGLGDTPAWNIQNVSTNVVYWGQRLIITDTNFIGWYTGMRFWTPNTGSNFAYDVFSIRNPQSNPLFSSWLVDFEASAAQWWNITVPELPVRIGDKVDLWVACKSIATPNSFGADWDYKRQNGDPSEGEIWHQSNNYEMRINYIDKDDTDQQTALSDVGVGSTIQGGGITWTITGEDFQGDHVRYNVEPASRAQEDLYTFTFTYYQAAPIDWPRIDNLYSGNPNIQGIFSTVGPLDPGIVADPHCYGGPDIRLQQALLSPDWDFAANSN